MIEIGRVCVKIAGREAGRICVIIDVLKSPYVMIDGAVRRKKCNINHLEVLPVVLKIKKAETTAKVLSELKKAGYEITAKKKRTKKAEKKPKPKRKRKAGEKDKKKIKKQKKAEKKKKEKKKPKKEKKKPAKKKSKK